MPDQTSRQDLVEIISTVLLALAAVARVWSSYQATRWHGEQGIVSGPTNRIRIEASRADSLAEAETEVDVATFIQWIDALPVEDVELADFYRQRFRDEFGPAFDAWLATDPFANRSSPPTPFAMPEYRLEASSRRRAARRCRRGVIGRCSSQHPAGLQLRAGRRALRRRPLLRRHE